MGIYGQPNSWQCGPFALKHALLSIGVFAHEDDLTLIARSSTDHGTDERQLARAARVHGCDLPVVRRGSAGGARHELAAQLARGRPVLLCVDNWEHWITAAAMHGDRVVVFDSHYDQPLRCEPWESLASRLTFRQRRWRGMWTRNVYDLMPLTPAWQGYQASLTPERVDYLLRPEHAAFARRWDEHASVLLDLGVPAGRQLEFGFPLADFVIERRDAIAAVAAREAGPDQRVDAERVIGELAFVAAIYRPVLRPEREQAATDRLGVFAARALASQPASPAARERVA